MPQSSVHGLRSASFTDQTCAPITALVATSRKTRHFCKNRPAFGASIGSRLLAVVGVRWRPLSAGVSGGRSADRQRMLASLPFAWSILGHSLGNLTISQNSVQFVVDTIRQSVRMSVSRHVSRGSVRFTSWGLVMSEVCTGDYAECLRALIAEHCPRCSRDTIADILTTLWLGIADSESWVDCDDVPATIRSARKRTFEPEHYLGVSEPLASDVGIDWDKTPAPEPEPEPDIVDVLVAHFGVDDRIVERALAVEGSTEGFREALLCDVYGFGRKSSRTRHRAAIAYIRECIDPRSSAWEAKPEFNVEQSESTYDKWARSR